MLRDWRVGLVEPRGQEFDLDESVVALRVARAYLNVGPVNGAGRVPVGVLNPKHLAQSLFKLASHAAVVGVAALKEEVRVLDRDAVGLLRGRGVRVHGG